MINIYEQIEKGQSLENDFTGNQFEVVEIKNETVTILRGENKTQISEADLRNEFSFYSEAFDY